MSALAGKLPLTTDCSGRRKSTDAWCAASSLSTTSVWHFTLELHMLLTCASELQTTLEISVCGPSFWTARKSPIFFSTPKVSGTVKRKSLNFQSLNGLRTPYKSGHTLPSVLARPPWRWAQSQALSGTPLVA